MAPNKFENHIKKQFEEREIRPSSDAWLKLSDCLDETVIERPKKRGNFWYAVAACLVGLLIVSVFVLNTTTAISESNNQVVEDETKAIDEIDDFEKIEVRKNAVEVVATEETPKEEKESIVVETAGEVPEKKASIEQLAGTSEEIQNPLNDASEEVLNIKIREVLAQVDALEQNQEQLTEAEVDSLLRKAQEEILSDKLFRNGRSVDAMALLNEVEDELDKSFRDQIFESLKSGFIKVRTAVADRNN